MASTPYPKSFVHEDYTVGWVCALYSELTAATTMLEQTHPELPKPGDDTNAYTLGSISGHNIVIACLPTGKIGNNSAAAVAVQMIRTFPSIRFGLMVGIGGGIPPKVRLGDVVVSTPTGGYPGVVQYDLGKAKEGGRFERTGALNTPPKSLLTAITKLRAEHERTGSRVPEYLNDLGQRYPKMAPTYLRTDSLKDVLFKSSYSHVVKSPTTNEEDGDEDEDEEDGCLHCDKTMVVNRKTRTHNDLVVHYGLVASGNQVVKNAAVRNEIKKSLEDQALCVEMEAAGLVDNFPCMVIRGICDYADSHKNDRWQSHAAAVAAAFARELLSYVQPSDVKGESTVKDILDQMRTEVQRCEERVNALKSTFNKREDLETLDWLTLVNYGPQQSDYFSRRQPGTGGWFLGSTEFKTWVEGRKQTLFCPGIPGSGKTIITSIVVDKLITTFRGNDDIGIVYLYCNFRMTGCQNAEELISSMLKQLSQSRSSLPENVKSLHNKHKDEKTRPSFDEISRALHSVASEYTRVFVVIDALDECQASNGCRDRVLSEIFALQAKCEASLFVTSRDIPEITAEFTQSMTVEVRATDEDVKRYIEGRIDRHMPRLRRQIENVPQLKDEIVTGITAAVQGMFLLAQIYLGLLNDKVTPKKVRQALAEFQGQASGEGQMGKQLTNAYDQTMARIMGQEQGFRDLAKEVLMWITCAEEPLATVTLQHALAVEKNATKLSEDNFTDVSVIVSVCGGLVTVNEQNGIVRLVHYTAQEYFEHAQEIWFPDAQSDITQACVTYLSFSAFVSRACSTPLEIHIKRLLRTYPLYRYAVCNWGNHARKSSRLDGVVKEFLGCEAKIHATSQALLVAKTDNRAMTQSLCGLSLGPTWTAAGLHGLHLAATFGLHEAVTLLLHLNLNARDYFGRTPLTIAAEAGQTVFVKVLLDTRQAEVDSKDSFDRTPLSWAAQGGHNATVKLLLVNQAEVNSEDRSGRTPLAWATLGGYEATVSLLLAVSQVKIDLKDSCGLTPLSWAAIGGYEAIVKALLATGQVNINSKDQYNGMTPLGYAAQGGHENALKVLLASQAEADTKDTYGQTPLSWAASDGYEEIVKLLVGTGQVQVNSKDIGGQTPLTWAARGGHEGTIRILLATHRVEVDSKDNNGRTALSWAAQGGHEVTVKLLLATGQAKIDSKDRDGETPLSWAAQGGHEATVKLLVGSQAEGLSKNAKDQTLFNWAAMTGHEATVRLIREFGNAAGIWSAAPVEE